MSIVYLNYIFSSRLKNFELKLNFIDEKVKKDLIPI